MSNSCLPKCIPKNLMYLNQSAKLEYELVNFEILEMLVLIMADEIVLQVYYLSEK